MKVFSINGLSSSGKTTAVERIIKELKNRKYSVGSVKEIHYEKFKMDVDGTNTHRHKNAGASLVTARGMHETDVLYQKKLSIDKILSFYDQDYVILEGVNDINAPKIITAHNTQEIDDKLDYRTLLISGVIADQIQEYKGFDVIHCINDTKRLVDIIEEKVPELMSDFDPKCCGECGYDCHTMLTKIIAGEKKQQDCLIHNENIKLSINGREIKMVPFVQKILHNTVLGIAKELHGFEEKACIEILIGDTKK